MSIAMTAAVRAAVPQESPIESGIVPIAACTVAFGVYAAIQKSLSFGLSYVLIIDRATPSIRKMTEIITSAMTAAPAETAY